MREERIILVAEDDEGQFSLVKKYLARSGLGSEVVRFRDGQEILDFLLTHIGTNKRKRKKFILILDIRMPKVDGFEVLRQIKENKELCSMPVVILTTTDNVEEMERCYNLGCSAYVVKPVGYDDFTDAISKIGSFLSFIEVPTV